MKRTTLNIQSPRPSQAQQAVSTNTPSEQKTRSVDELDNSDRPLKKRRQSQVPTKPTTFDSLPPPPKKRAFSETSGRESTNQASARPPFFNKLFELQQRISKLTPRGENIESYLAIRKEMLQFTKQYASYLRKPLHNLPYVQALDKLLKATSSDALESRPEIAWDRLLDAEYVMRIYQASEKDATEAARQVLDIAQKVDYTDATAGFLCYAKTEALAILVHARKATDRERQSFASLYYGYPPRLSDFAMKVANPSGQK